MSLNEASRLAHSVRVAYPRDIRYVDDTSQLFDDDEMDGGTMAGLSASATGQNSYHSASTARRKRGKCFVPDPSNLGNQAWARHPNVSEELLDSEDGDDVFSWSPGMAAEDPSNDDAGMEDHMPTSNRGGSPSATGPREGGEVRRPECVFHILTCMLESLRDFRRD